MFLKQTTRFKDGKEHHYWSLVENRRVDGGRKVVQRHVLYLGEINSNQQEAWRKTIEVLETGSEQPRTVALFPEERCPHVEDKKVVRIRLNELELRRPRQWGACWLASVLYQKLELDAFWTQRLQPSRKGTRWDHVLQTLVTYRLIDPGSEWRLHPDLLPALAQLITKAADTAQVWVVTHSPALMSALCASPDARVIELEKELGQTQVRGQNLLDRPQWKWVE